jgi:ATP-dependent Zn protease
MDEEFGLATLSGSEMDNGALAEEVRRRVNVLLEEQMEEAVSLIGSGKRRMDRLIAALLTKNRLTREEMEGLLSFKKASA